MKHVVQFSGGVGSWATSRYVKDKIVEEGDELILLFADTLIEDEQTYAFLDAAAADIGVELTRICMNETPWDVFKRKRFLGNSRIDPCSENLKRKPLRAWIEENCVPESTVIYIGIDWTEEHRLLRARPRWKPWDVQAPLVEARWSKQYMHRLAEHRGLPKQRLYEFQLAHANCGGGCVKAGQGHWAQLYEKFPERYLEWERNEAEVIEFLDKPVAMMTEMKKGVKRPLPLSVLRQRLDCKKAGEKLEEGEEVDMFDIGGCGCALE